jgi:2-polyprenyl-6-methoxyphenol hydroxylase-like FAD-dependent oxidoreductase
VRGRVVVDGAGVAGLTCARLLADRGWNVVVVERGRGPAPTIVLNQLTLMLLGELWGHHHLLDGAHPLTERRIRWGDGSPMGRVQQVSAAVDGQRLVNQLRLRLLHTSRGRVQILERPLAAPAADQSRNGPAWVIDATGRGSTMAGPNHRPPWFRSFGRRVILAADVALRNAADSHVCWMETVPNGWVFLAPLGHGQGLLQAMVAERPADQALALSDAMASTACIHGLVEGLASPVATFDAAPRLREPIGEAGWLSVGEAAMRLDPISGYGVAYAIREAILATAVIDTAGAAASSQGYLSHYQHRLRDAFIGHLDACIGLYGAGLASPTWNQEIKPMRQAVEAARRTPPMAYRYRLTGIRLVELAPADPTEPPSSDAGGRR